MKSQNDISLSTRDECLALATQSRAKDKVSHGGNGNTGEKLKEKKVLSFLNKKNTPVQSQIQALANHALGEWVK